MEMNEPLEKQSSVPVAEDQIEAASASVGIATATTVKSKRSPSDFLKSVLGRPVRVKLNSGTEYRGMSWQWHCHTLIQ
jgi:hypothetical protein